MKKQLGKTTWVLSFLLGLSVLLFQPNPVQAEDVDQGIPPEAQQLIDSVYEATVSTMQERAAEAGQAIGTVSAAIQENIETILAAREYLNDMINTNTKTWTDETWNHFLEIFKQAGVAVDELIPSVSGCIHDDQGNPMRGVLVAMIPRADGLPMLPSFAITGNGSFEQHPGNHSSFGFNAGIPSLPVSDSFLPESYRNEFNQGGCYMVPVPPQLMKIYIQSCIAIDSSIGEDPTFNASFDAIIHPIFPGYNMGPYEQKIVFKAGGVAEITNMDTGATRTVRAQ